MGLSLTFLGKSCDRWRVRVEADDLVALSGLTLSLVSETGRQLGPSVVAPDDMGDSWVAELRGPSPLPPGTVVRAMTGLCGGAILEAEVPVDRRRGLHAFLHGDARLPVETEPVGEPLTAREAVLLGEVFPWVCGCGPRPERVDNRCPGDLAELLRDCGVDPDDVDASVIEQMRR